MSEKPLLFADTRTDAERFDPRLHRGHMDPSRIPGYSEQVMANDIAKADDLFFRDKNNGRTKEDLYRQIGATPGPLEVEFAWLPISAAGGAEVSSHQVRQLDHYQNAEGFYLASEEDLDRYGYEFPPTARLAEDGTIRRGPDVALFVRSGEVARMWEKFKFEEQKALSDGPPPDEFTSRTETIRGHQASAGYSGEVFTDEEKVESVTVKH